jgi:hypothetical protein
VTVSGTVTDGSNLFYRTSEHHLRTGLMTLGTICVKKASAPGARIMSKNGKMSERKGKA